MRTLFTTGFGGNGRRMGTSMGFQGGRLELPAEDDEAINWQKQRSLRVLRNTSILQTMAFQSVGDDQQKVGVRAIPERSARPTRTLRPLEALWRRPSAAEKQHA